MELVALCAVAAAFLVALILTPLIRNAAISANFVDRPGERKIHSRDIAYGGGIAVALSMGLACGLAAFGADRWFEFSSSDDPSPQTLWVIGIGALGALVLGLVDDKVRLSPTTKLLFQLVLAIGTVWGGVRITALIGDNLFMQTVTVCWIVLITNSFNLLDNMDGLCSGTVSIAAAVLGMVALSSGQWVLTLALAALCGACLGFLRYNRSPATIFLGDGGSLFCGYLMACFTALVTYFRYSDPGHLAVGIPVLVLAIPLYDTASVIVIRLREKRPIMRGDTSHFSHRLVDLGMSRRQAVATIHLACLAIGLPATVLAKLPLEHGLLIVGQCLLVLTIIALLEKAGRARSKEFAALKASGSSGRMPAVTQETTSGKDAQA